LEWGARTLHWGAMNILIMPSSEPELQIARRALSSFGGRGMANEKFKRTSGFAIEPFTRPERDFSDKALWAAGLWHLRRNLQWLAVLVAINRDIL